MGLKDAIYRAWVGFIEKPVEGSKLKPVIIAQHGQGYSKKEDAITEAADVGSRTHGWIEKDGEVAHATELKNNLI